MARAARGGRAWLPGMLAFVGLLGCPASPAPPPGIRLVEVTSTAFLEPLLTGTFEGNQAAHGSGVALADLDGDGRIDLVVAAGSEPGSAHQGVSSAVYWNTSRRGQISFERDPATSALLAGFIGIGVAVGDYDGDGDLDLYFAGKGQNRLLQNDGYGAFTEVTAAAGVAGSPSDISASAVFADLDSDGLLDLYVSNFVDPGPMGTGQPSAPGPNQLYLNQGDGTFREVAEEAFANLPTSNFVTAAVDHDGDGRLALYVGVDRYFEPENVPDSFLVVEELTADGLAYRDAQSELGLDPRGTTNTMGISIADLNEDGREDFFVSDIGENDLYVSQPDGTYALATDAWGLGRRSPPGFDDINYVAWGACFVDLDYDGAWELYVVNGFIDYLFHADTTQAQQNLFFRSEPGQPYFVDYSAEVGLPAAPRDDPWPNGRGLALGDLDGDGDDDLVTSPFVDHYRVYRNDTVTPHRAVRVALVGTSSSPTPVGATLRVETSMGRAMTRRLHAGGVVHSDDRRPLVAGLGEERDVARVEVLWPSGIVQRIDTLAEFGLDRTVTVVEPRWYALSTRVATAASGSVLLHVVEHDEAGTPMGPVGAGREVTVERSDAVQVEVTDEGDGSYRAELTHPGDARRVRLTITVDGVVRRTRPTVRFE